MSMKYTQDHSSQAAKMNIPFLHNSCDKGFACQSGVFPILFVKMNSTIPTFKSGAGLRIVPQERIH